MPNGIDIETELVAEMINGFRIAQGKGPLNLSAQLTLGAKHFALSMLPRFEEIKKGTASDVTKDEERIGWTGEIAGFGSGKDQHDVAEHIVEEWFKNPEKRKLILKAKNSLGVGLAAKNNRVFVSARML